MTDETSYIFILGRNAEISVAEIKAIFEKEGWSYNPTLESYEVLIVSSNNASAELLHETLGGTIKIGKVEKVSTRDAFESDLSTDFLLEKIFVQTGSKIQFGISVYNGGDRRATEVLAGQIISFSKGIKALLEQKDLSVRFAFSRDRFLSSVTVAKNKLIQKGAEILLIAGTESIYIGKTLFVQEFEQFSARDYGRPARDLKSGIMPPKLARMMINLVKINSAGVLLDPFCGSGTVLQEALLLGYTHVIGRDNSERAVTDTKTNLVWLEQEMPFDSNSRIDVARGDATRLNLSPNSVSGVVTEPYLGPTLHGQVYPEKLQGITQELGSLYTKSFAEFQKILKPGGGVVMILPVFVLRNELYYMPILSDIERIGFKQEKLAQTKRGSFTYGNKYDFILREIVKFKKA